MLLLPLYVSPCVLTVFMCRRPVVEPARIPTLPLSIAHASDVLDMPVDPNEPTYCICRQVSYGEMIGCDNPDVSSTVVSYFCTSVCVHLICLLINL